MKKNVICENTYKRYLVRNTHSFSNTHTLACIYILCMYAFSYIQLMQQFAGHLFTVRGSFTPQDMARTVCIVNMLCGLHSRCWCSGTAYGAVCQIAIIIKRYFSNGPRVRIHREWPCVGRWVRVYVWSVQCVLGVVRHYDTVTSRTMTVTTTYWAEIKLQARCTKAGGGKKKTAIGWPVKFLMSSTYLALIKNCGRASAVCLRLQLPFAARY